jgi:NAD+ kinase
MTQAQIARVGIVAKTGLVAAADHLHRLAKWLRDRQLEPVFETDTATLAGDTAGAPTYSRETLPAQVDFIIVLGGDGTLLSMATRTAQSGRDIPILGVNFGSLGFLTEARIDELYTVLESVLNGSATFDDRAMLAADAYRTREHFDSRIVLNDVVFTKAALSRIIELSVSVGDQQVMQVRADGLIVATPTGSSAYNLAAGGPIVHPVLDAFLLTPIAPHMLTNRPVVLPASADIRVTPLMDGSSEEVYVTFDGQSGHPLQPKDVIEIQRAKTPLRLVRASKRTYFDVLRQKLKWGER